MSAAGKLVVAFFALLVGLRTSAIAQPVTSQTEMFSRDGILTATLVAQAGKIRVGDLELDATIYNGVYAGPVLHVHAGDLIRLKLVNRLAQPTNLHFHGLRSSPLGNGDNAHLVIQPNSSFDYEVRISLIQPAGLFWYHAHVHGLSEVQIMGGLSGTIVVEPSQPVAVASRLFVMKDMVFDEDTGNETIDDTLHGIVQSVNGQLTTSESMRPGETQMWRFTNQSANRVLHLALADHQFRVIARDGEAVVTEQAVDTLEISPASRIDVLVDSGVVGRYALLAKGVITGMGPDKKLDRIIGYLDVAGDVNASPPSMPRATAPSLDLRSLPVDATRELVLSQTKAAKLADQRFFINGKLFEAERIDARVKMGDIEEWTIRNDSDDTHVFHIHQMAFQVTEVNGMPVPFNGYLDTIRIPERGEVKLRMPFTDPTIIGRFMFHCHVLRHEDRGMMANVEVYDPSQTFSTRLVRLYMRVVWWWHGVPWSQCGMQDI